MTYEADDKAFPADAYHHSQYPGIAFYVFGWETEPDEETEWSGYEVRTGNVVTRMVGDDRDFSHDPEDLEAIEPDSFCRTCGQIGCTHNTYT